jgi:ABC-type antimicrobial peptide transport system permease subunit
MLVTQFLGEAVFMAFLSLFLASFIVIMLLPLFNQLTGKQLEIKPDAQFIALILGATLFTGILSGSYPAFYLSRFDPITVLKGKMKNSTGELIARKGLVVFQFIITLVLIIAVIVIYRQAEFVQTKNIGYNKANIIQFDKEGTIMKHSEAFLTGLKKIPGIKAASSMQQSIIQSNNIGPSTYGIDWPGKSPNDLINFNLRAVDQDMIETLGLKFNEGRSFSKELGSEDSKLIFNETAIKAMGLKDPVGTTVNMWGKDMTIVGVIKDFHLSSLHEAIEPMVFSFSPERTTTIMARIEPGKEKTTLDKIESYYKKFNPGYVFDYKFLDDAYQAQYVSEQRVSLLSRYFAGLAILISCLGLFGLVSFNAEIRTKEIGIRKILGASSGNLMMMLSKDFIRLVIIAILVAFPLAWWVMNNWLSGYAYHVKMRAAEFVIAGTAILIITLLTMSYQSIRTALMNPVKSLRTE